MIVVSNNVKMKNFEFAVSEISDIFWDIIAKTLISGI